MSWKDFFELDEGEPGSPEWYLNKVKDWTDPNPPPVVEQHDGVYVVRDDFLVGGTKERIYDYMVQNDPAKEWVYGGGSRWGYGQIGLAAVCKKYGKRATVFIAAAKELHPSSVKAQELGCQIIPCNMGMLTVTQGRARKYVAEDPQHRKLVEFSGDPAVIGSVIKVARTIPFEPDEVWSVAGSGVLNRGLQLAFPNAKCYAVSIGHNLSVEERGRAEIIKHPLPFAQECKSQYRPPFPSSPNYDAKAWWYVQNHSDKSKRVLFWNVGA
jgi:hypothetical protein